MKENETENEKLTFLEGIFAFFLFIGIILFLICIALAIPFFIIFIILFYILDFIYNIYDNIKTYYHNRKNRR